MTTIWTYVLLVVGFVLLIKGADFFVEGSSGIAKKLKVPSLIIGLTIVAMGTSLPECAVSVAASISGNNALAVSNVVGSNIFNLMVVCGFCAVITPLAVGKSDLKAGISVFCAYGSPAFSAGLHWNERWQNRWCDFIDFLCSLHVLDGAFCIKGKNSRNYNRCF